MEIPDHTHASVLDRGQGARPVAIVRGSLQWKPAQLNEYSQVILDHTAKPGTPRWGTEPL